MKNLILTFVFALVSLISFSQFTIGYLGGDSTGTLTVPDVALTEYTIYVNGNVTIGVIAVVNLNVNVIERMSDFSTTAFPYTYIGNDSILPMIMGETKYLLFNNAGNISHLTVSFLDPSASVSENSLTSKELKVYPNPTTDFLHLNIENYSGSFEVFDMAGKLLIQTTEKTIDVRSLSPGSYILHAGERVQKVIVE